MAVLAGSILAGLIQPTFFESHMQMLVKRERVDPIVSADPNPISQNAQPLTEEELQSEVELFRSEDSLRSAVTKVGLSAPERRFWSFNRHSGASSPSNVALATRRLAKDLTVSVVKKTNLIDARYSSEDPNTAARVLTTLGNLYLAKHATAHSSSGANDFFEKEANKYEQHLATAEQQLIGYDRVEGISDAQQEKQMTLQKLMDTEASLKETRAAIAEREQMLESLNKKLASTPARETTQVRTSDAAVLLQQLQFSLLTLQLKRTELLGKFEPTYEPVQQLQSQITDTQAAIDQVKKNPVHEETTDQTSTYEWLRSETAKAESILPGLRARATVLEENVERYRDRLSKLDEAEVAQQGFQREAKVAQDTFLLYQRKKEEARISEALNRQGIVNVAVTEPPSVPILPTGSHPAWRLLMGFVLASLVSVGSAFGAEKLDPTFQTPDQLQDYIDLPVLAVFPESNYSSATSSSVDA